MRSGSCQIPSPHSQYHLKVSPVMKSKLIMPALNSAQSFRAPWPSWAVLFCLTFVWDLNLTLGQLQPLTYWQKRKHIKHYLEKTMEGLQLGWHLSTFHIPLPPPRLRLFNWERTRTDVILNTLHHELHQGPLFPGFLSYLISYSMELSI